ncbi:ABC transporter substrate-binding protein [Amycolatopsis thermoflava]|uniref:ABC transporter substrate-binding protein n=1 Tax=Amycolatopsis thermoflava TaxID=84480 RepID=UPI000A008E13|nr:ABC transporter substrate-binding protein [Amycolatopsis thermoflava]
MSNSASRTAPPALAAKRRGIGRREALRWGIGAGAGLVVGLPVLSGCSIGSQQSSGGGQGSPPATPTGVLRVGHPADPSSLDPSVAFDGATLSVLSNHVYEGLLRFKQGTSDVEGLLAESYESSPDAREWTFRLREGVKFHDGEVLNSTAVRKTFEYYSREDAGLSLLIPADAVFDDSDPAVFRVKSPKPAPDMARNATLVGIISPKLVAQGVDVVKATAVGTGPFRFVSYTAAKSIVLTANPDYRGPGPYVQEVQFLIIPDASARASALRSGSIDLVAKVAPADAVALRSDRNLVVQEAPTWSQSEVIFFLKSPVSDNLKVRQAVAHAIDKAALIKSIQNGVGTPAESVLPPGVYGYHAPATKYSYDLGKAQQIIAECGLSSPVQAEIIWAPELGASLDKMAFAISGMVKKIGVELKVTQKPIGEIAKQIMDTTLQKPYQSVMGDMGWLNGAPLFLTTGYFETVSGFEELKPLKEKMVSTPDGPERLQVIADMQELFARQLPMIPLYTVTEIDVHRSAVQGYSVPRDGFLPRLGEVYLSA